MMREEDWLLTRLTEDAEMSPPDANTLLQWCLAVRDQEKKPVALVGAGMSLNAVPKAGWADRTLGGSEPKAKTWGQLADVLRTDLAGDIPGGRHSDAKDDTDPLWLAELYRQRFDRNALLNRIKQAVPDDLLEPGPPHRELTKIDWEAVVTTNYDTLIERAFRREGRDVQLCISDQDLVQTSTGKLPLLHAHGHFGRTETIILTLEDYRKYPDKHPGMLTKIRQLFIQHPVLLLGFSGVDPNFIQWTGWVSDLVGDLRNPCVSLVVPWGRPGQARQRYWDGALHFVAADPGHLPTVLSLVAQFLRPVGTDEALEEAKRCIEGAATIEGLIPATRRALSLVTDTDRLERGAQQAIKVVRAVAHQASIIVGEDPSPALPRSPFFSPGDREKDIFESRRQEPSQHSRQAVGQVRRWFGQHWIGWLIEIAEAGFPDIPLVGLRDNPPILEEVERLLNAAQSETSTAPALRRLQVAVLEDKLAANPDADPKAVVEQWIGDDLEPQQPTVVDDILARERFRRGDDVSADTGGVTAQSRRRAGFLATLRGEFNEGFAHYKEAVGLSLHENEPLIVRWLTVDAALSTWQAAGAFSLPDPGADVLQLKVDLARLGEREPRQVEELRDLETEAYRQHAKHLRHQLDQPQSATKHPFTWGIPESPARRTLARLERMWAYPGPIAGVAAIRGLELWISRRHDEAARLLARYGSSQLAPLVKTVVDDGTVDLYESGLVELLLEPGRWPPEWHSKLEFLPSVVGSLVNADVDGRLGAWINRCVREVGDRGSVVVRDGIPGVSTYPIEHLADLMVRRWSLLDYATFTPDWARFANAQDNGPGRLWLALAERAGRLPWKTWITERQVDHADVQKLWATALEVSGSRGRGAARLVEEIDLLLDWLSGHIPTFSVTSELRDALNRWLRDNEKSDYMYGPLSTFLEFRVSERMATCAREAFLAESIAVLSDDSTEPWVVANHLHVLAEMTGDELLQVREPVVTYLTKVADDPERACGTAPEERIYEATAHVASALLRLKASDSDKVCRQILIDAVERFPICARWVGAVPARRLGTKKRDVEERIVMMLAGGPPSQHHTPVYVRGCAFQAVRERVQRNTGALSPAWFDGVLASVFDENGDIAAFACRILAEAAARKRLPGPSNSSWRRWFRQLRFAATDSLVRVRAAAFFALVSGRRAFPNDHDDHSSLVAMLDEEAIPDQAEVRQAVRDARSVARETSTNSNDG